MKLQDQIQPHRWEHGKRGAACAKELRGNILDLTDGQFEILSYACEWDTAGRDTDNITVATCWDADRLDLGRVGIISSKKYLLTNEAKRIAIAGVDAWEGEVL